MIFMVALHLQRNSVFMAFCRNNIRNITVVFIRHRQNLLK